MSELAAEYVERTADGGWRLSGSRVSLDSIVYAYHDGASPEAIIEDFPSLTAEQVYGAIAYYLRHKEEVDRQLALRVERWEQARQASAAENAPLLERLRVERGSNAENRSP